RPSPSGAGLGTTELPPTVPAPGIGEPGPAGIGCGPALLDLPRVGRPPRRPAATDGTAPRRPLTRAANGASLRTGTGRTGTALPRAARGPTPRRPPLVRDSSPARSRIAERRHRLRLARPERPREHDRDPGGQRHREGERDTADGRAGDLDRHRVTDEHVADRAS